MLKMLKEEKKKNTTILSAECFFKIYTKEKHSWYERRVGRPSAEVAYITSAHLLWDKVLTSENTGSGRG